VSFTANPTTITFDGSTTLSWTTANATACTLGDGTGLPEVVDVNDSISFDIIDNGNLDWDPGDVITLTLACTGPGLFDSEQIEVTVDPNVVINSSDDVDLLADFNDLPGNLTIQNPGFTTEVVLDGLNELDGSLIITGTTTLIQVDLSNLDTIWGDVVITNNQSLTSIDLSQLNDLGGDFTLTGNSSLAPPCDVADIPDDLAANGWTGTATVNNNPFCF
jgi:hypothetical protein